MLAIGLVYNMHYYSGAVFQIVATSRRKNRTAMEVLAAGGRYDDLVSVRDILLLIYSGTQEIFLMSKITLKGFQG